MKKRFLLKESHSGTVYELKVPSIVGRSSEADLTLRDPGISKKHAQFLEIDHGIWIEDLNSSNGVYVRGSRIKEKTPLSAGDCLRFGQTELVLLLEPEQQTEKTCVFRALDIEPLRDLDHERLKLIYGISAELTETQDLAVLGRKIFAQFKEIFRQDRGYIALFREDGTLEPVSFAPVSQPPPISRNILDRVFRSGESILLEDALDEDLLKKEKSVVALKIRSALCAPLVHGHQIYGLIYLDRNVPKSYKQDDLELLTAIGFMLAPLIENARLWSELKDHYEDAMDTLKRTEAKMIEMERKNAYVRLAQAIAHEIRNPMMAMGGMVSRMSRSTTDNSERERLQSLLSMVHKIEDIINEVDAFVAVPVPHKKLVRIDMLINEAIEELGELQSDPVVLPSVSINTSQVSVPLHDELFRKALSLIFKEILWSTAAGTSFDISLRDSGNDLEIMIGEGMDSAGFCELFEPELHDKSWALGLFINMAQKIISDQGGRILVVPESRSILPILIKIPLRPGH